MELLMNIDTNAKKGKVKTNRKLRKKQQKMTKTRKVTETQSEKVLKGPKVTEKTVQKAKRLSNFKGKRSSVCSTIGSEVRDDRTVVPINERVFSASKFVDLNLSELLVENLKKSTFDVLTTVQSKVIPRFLTGANLFIRSQTGSGKTLAYAVPIVEILQSISPKLKRTDGIRVLVLVPTRELVVQTFETFAMLLKTFHNIVPGFVYGGANRGHEKARFRKGMNILIGTPGRLLDHILHTNSCKLDQIRCVVFDEADRLLDMGFKKDITKIIEILDQQLKDTSEEHHGASLGSKKHLKFDLDLDLENYDKHPLKKPQSNERQTILLSATLTKSVNELVDLSMKNQHVFIDSIESGETSKGNPQNYLILPKCVQQNYLVVPTKSRLVTLSAVILGKLNDNVDGCCKIFVFMATCDMVEYHEVLFKSTFLQSGCDNDGDEFRDNDDFENEPFLPSDITFLKLHGSMTQTERKHVFDQFRKSKQSILFCTDVAARGLDVPLADTIIHYTSPITDEDYVHRTGRTGRVERPGNSIIFLSPEEVTYATHLQSRKAKIKQQKLETVLNSIPKFYENCQFDSKEALMNHLQHRFETVVEESKKLHELACLAYTSWAHFYHTYPHEMRKMFEFKKCHLGHYSTSFALTDPPTKVANFVRQQRKNSNESRSKMSDCRARFNKNLANHEDESEDLMDRPKVNRQQNKRKAALHNEFSVSEFGSGIEKKQKTS